MYWGGMTVYIEVADPQIVTLLKELTEGLDLDAASRISEVWVRCFESNRIGDPDGRVGGFIYADGFES